jgi:hypothetical protein
MAHDGIDEQTPRFNKLMSSAELLRWMMKCRKEARAFCSDIHKETDYYWSVTAAEALSEDDKKFLREAGRPEIDPPFAAGVLDAVLGMEIAADVTPVFHGVDSGHEDQVIADWLTRLLRNGFKMMGADDAMLEAFHDCLVGGYGFVQFYLDMRRMPFRAVGKHLNYWQVWWEPGAVEKNLRDSDFFGIESEWELEDAEANWSSEKQRGLILQAASGSKKGKAPGGSPLPQMPGATSAYGRMEKVKVTEFQYRRSVARARYADPETGEEVDSTRDDYEARKKELATRAAEQRATHEEQLGMWRDLAEDPDPAFAATAGPEPPEPQVVEITDEYEEEFVAFYNGYSYRRAFVVGEDEASGGVLEDKEIDLPLPGDEPGFTIKAVTGYAWRQKEKKRVRRYGLMRKIVNIQEWFTKFIRQYLELQSRKIKGGGFVEKGAFEGIPGGFEAFVRKAPSGGHWQMVADGAIQAGKIKENGAMSGEPGLLEGINMMREMFGWVTGVTQGLQGTLTQDRANILVENQQEHGLQMLLPIRQPRRDFLLACGRLYAAIVIKHLPAKEIDRILGVQQIEGMTVEKQMGPDGRPVYGPDGPVLIPILGDDGQPMTAGTILKNADLLDFDVEADIAQAKETEKTKFMTAWQQHGLGAIIQQALPGPAGTRIWIGELFKNMMPNAAAGKEMAAKADAYLLQLEQQESAQGISAAFEQMAAADPDGASQLLQQLVQIMSGGEEAPPEEQAA